MQLKCNFEYITTKPGEIFYGCIIENQKIPEEPHPTFSGQHKHGKNNDDVQYVKFKSCFITKVPQGLTKVFKNFVNLNIFESKLKKISKIDLIEYKNLKRLLCESNELEFLPGDLFDGFENLEWIGFWGNRLKIIEPNILDGLKNLKLVNFSKNANYNKLFAIYPVYKSTSTLEDIRDQLYEKFFCVDRQSATNFIARVRQQALNSWQSEVDLTKLQFNSDKASQANINAHSAILADLNNFIKDEATKDFQIQIDDHEFPVHKFLLAARSPTLAEILKNNPEVENLNLVDISVEIFEIILKFLYTDELPGEDGTNFMQLFAAAGKLKIQELMNYAGNKLIEQVYDENADDIFRLGCKYENTEMKQKAFKVIKGKYPGINFKDEWANDPEKVSKMIELFNRKAEAMRKIEQEFAASIINELN